MCIVVNFDVPSDYQRQGQDADAKFNAAKTKVTELIAEQAASQSTLRELDVSITHIVMTSGLILVLYREGQGVSTATLPKPGKEEIHFSQSSMMMYPSTYRLWKMRDRLVHYIIGTQILAHPFNYCRRRKLTKRALLNSTRNW